MGSPGEAVFPLSHLLEKKHHQLVGVVSRSPKPKGRGRGNLVDPPVASFAKEKGLLLLQPEKPNQAEFLNQISLLAPDIVDER